MTTLTSNLQTIICTTLDKGVFITNDRGKNWSAYTEGLTDENFWTSYYDPIKRKIYAACPSGIYERKINL